MHENDRNRLKQLLTAFDETGLIALANKGLVRRASKDYQAGGISHEENDQAVIIKGPDWTVTMPADGPSSATDDTRATGISRHILCATMYLRDQWATETELAITDDANPVKEANPPESDAPPVNEKQADKKAGQSSEKKPKAALETSQNDSNLLSAVLAINSEQLAKWAGKNIYRQALGMFSAASLPEDTQSGNHTCTYLVHQEAGLSVQFPDHDQTWRLLPGPWQKKKGANHVLDAILTTAGKSSHALWVSLGILALHHQAGEAMSLNESQAREIKEAALSREQVLENSVALLRTLTAAGIAHPSRTLAERLETLAISALAVHLPRLSRLLKSLSHDTNLIMERHADADNIRLLEMLAYAHALVLAIRSAGESAPYSLTGRHRSEYLPVGELKLTGLGAYPFQTSSGYMGLTVLFWDHGAERFRSWSYSRPTEQHTQHFYYYYYQHNALTDQYESEKIWQGAPAPDSACRSEFSLHEARVNQEDRLSASSQSFVNSHATADPLALEKVLRKNERLFDSWPALFQYAEQLSPLGLKETNPMDHLVILKPEVWGDRFFDELNQRFTWELKDEAENAIHLSLPWAEINESPIDFLEKIKPDRERLWGVLVRLDLNEGLRLTPLSLYCEESSKKDKVLNPAFDLHRITSRRSSLLNGLKQKYGRNRIQVDQIHGEKNQRETALPVLPGKLLSEFEAMLQFLAESGSQQLSTAEKNRLKIIADGFNRLGLDRLGEIIPKLSGAALASTVLEAYYLCQLHRQAAARFT